KKALYGLKQAPRAWYDGLSTFRRHLSSTGCKDTFKSTFGEAQFLGEKLDQTMALQPHSSRIKIKDLMLH
nr:hypothetical protein [Tanacetum cinerariifolium]